ncbi:hypothetical protein [Gordonia sp. KTR9]|uniref:hypothetical protein n=1 Tax=Gordonia sp. KTR9 TaxID=337191 RepID=UPI0011D2444F|nr:hypothetical protein [Gordonia sp. KTR9]
MAFREISVNEIREVLRLWLGTASLAVMVSLKQARLRTITNTIAALVVLVALIPVSGLALPLGVALSGGFGVAAALYSTTRTNYPSAAPA